MKTKACIVAVLMLTINAYAVDIKRTATVTSVEGLVEVRIGKTDSWRRAQKGMVMMQDDIIRTAKDSQATVCLDGKNKSAAVNVASGSEMRIATLTRDEDNNTTDTLLDLAVGKVLIEVEKIKKEGSTFEVKTPTSVVGVRGTTFEVKVETVK